MPKKLHKDSLLQITVKVNTTSSQKKTHGPNGSKFTLDRGGRDFEILLDLKGDL